MSSKVPREALIVGLDGLGGVFLHRALTAMERGTNNFGAGAGADNNNNNNNNGNIKYTSSFPIPPVPNLRFCFNAGGCLDSRCVFPAISAPVWASVLTGLAPHQHGIKDNAWTPVAHIFAPETDAATTAAVIDAANPHPSFTHGAVREDTPNVLRPVGGTFSFCPAIETQLRPQLVEVEKAIQSSPSPACQQSAAGAEKKYQERLPVASILRRPLSVFNHVQRALGGDGVVCAAFCEWSVWLFPFLGYSSHVVAAQLPMREKKKKKTGAAVFGDDGADEEGESGQQRQQRAAAWLEEQVRLEQARPLTGPLSEQLTSRRDIEIVHEVDAPQNRMHFAQGTDAEVVAQSVEFIEKHTTNKNKTQRRDEPKSSGSSSSSDQKKNFLMYIHLDDADADGHSFGWGSAEYFQQFKAQDEYLGRLMAAFGLSPSDERTHEQQGGASSVTAELVAHKLLVVLSDHGGLAKNHGDLDKQNQHNMILAFEADVYRDRSTQELFWVRRPKLAMFALADELRQKLATSSSSIHRGATTADGVVAADFEGVGSFISVLDVTPTVLEFFGATQNNSRNAVLWQHAMQGHALQGRSSTNSNRLDSKL